MQSPYAQPAKSLRLGDALEFGGSALVFAFSFAPFITITIPGLFGGGAFDDWQNAWATETFMAPLTWFVVLAGLLQIAAVTLRYLGGRDPQLLGFRLTQLELGLGLFMLVVLFSMVTSEKHVIFGAGARALGEGGADLDIGWGAILMLVGALAAAAGAVLSHLSVGPTIVPWPAGPAPDPAPDQAYPPSGAQPHAGSPETQPYPAPPAAPPSWPPPSGPPPSGPPPSGPSPSGPPPAAPPERAG